jgi:hypothetical protein
MKNLESKIVILVIFLGILLYSCKNKTTTQRQSTNKTTTQYQSADDDDQLISYEEDERLCALDDTVTSIEQKRDRVASALTELETLLDLHDIRLRRSSENNSSDDSNASDN